MIIEPKGTHMVSVNDRIPNSRKNGVEFEL